MKVQDQQLSLLVDDSAAQYPLTIDPSLQQEAYIKASNTNADDLFGVTVAISGDTMVVGAAGEASNATDIDGDQTDNSAILAGAAYVFTRKDSIWSQQAYLKASNTDSDDAFGVSIAILDDTVVVGASGEDSNATGIDGDQTNNSTPFSGAAYVFTREDGVWSQQAYLKASNTGVRDDFGSTIAISGNTVVIGANREASTATGINGNQTDNLARNAGAAYVFTRENGIWSQQAYLKASNTDKSDFFGGSVSISGNTVVVGADGEDSNATDIDGDQMDNSADSAGAAYVFTRENSAWSQQAYLKASNTNEGDFFGESVAISYDTVVVGARKKNPRSKNVVLIHPIRV